MDRDERGRHSSNLTGFRVFFTYRHFPRPHFLLKSAHLRIALSGALLVALVATTAMLPSSAPAEEAPDPALLVAGQETVTLDNGAEAVAGEVLVGYAGAAAPQTVDIPSSADPGAVAERIEKSPQVSYAIPNYIASSSGWLPDDSGVNPGRKGRWGGWRSKQWNFLPCLSFCNSSLPSDRPQSRGGMNVVRAWQNLRQAGRPGAAGVRIAVIDSGIAYRNYGRKFRRNPDVAANRFLPGYDFVGKDRLPLDHYGHGTHVAMTIGEQTDNGRALTGIAYRSKLMPVRVLDRNGNGSTSDIVAGVRWATRNNVRVMVMSLNFACGVSVPPLEQALDEAWKKGVIMVGSSGNIPNESCPSLPATSPRVISVGGTTESGCVASYTFESSEIDIAAPGGGPDRGNCPWTSRNRPIMQLGMVARDPSWFGIEPDWVGTSMAAAHVAGAAAAVLASGVLGDRTGPGRVAERLKATSRLPGYAKGNPASGFGSGIVNLGRATNPAVITD